MVTKENQLFVFDAEWVPIAKSYNDLEANGLNNIKEMWDRKVERYNADMVKYHNYRQLTSEEAWTLLARNYAELNKIICISFGFINNDNKFVVHSIYGDNEKENLELFHKVLKTVEAKNLVLAGHAIKRFDMPYIAKRMMINNIVPPSLINNYNKKPWDLNVFDTAEVWGQGVIQESYTSLDMLSNALGIQTSKSDEVNAKMVKEIYYNENDLEKIKAYCEDDVKVTFEVAKKLLHLQYYYNETPIF